MATQYTTILKLALPVQGELSGTWGDVVNENITSMVEEAIAGRAVINTWTTNSHTLTTANGLTSESRCAMLEFTDTGVALSGAGTVICPTQPKIYLCKNAAGQVITVTTAAGTGIAVQNGETKFVFCDGTNVVEAVSSMTTLKVGTGVQVNTILDEDNMASDSATALATQQSIKAYVDAQVTAQDLDFAGDTGTGAVDLDSQSLTIAGTANEIETAASGQTLTVGLPAAIIVTTSVTTPTVQTTNLNANDGTTAATIADATGVVTINSAVLTTADINGGTADNVVIGGTTAAAGSFTTVGATGNITSQGQVITNTINEQTATSGVTVDGVLLKDNGITATGGGSLTGTWSDLGSVTTIDINGGTIDGTVIGGSTAAAISGTTGQFGTSLNVDGTVTADGLTVDGNNSSIAVTSGTDQRALYLKQSNDYGYSFNLDSQTTGDLLLKGVTNGTETTRLKISRATGDISFYEDTGTTPKFFWDASAESLGLGTTNPSAALDVVGTTELNGNTTIVSASATPLHVNRNVSAGAATIQVSNSTHTTYFGTRSGGGFAINDNADLSSTPWLVIDSSGNVGIGTSSPATKLEVLGSSNSNYLRLSGDDAAGARGLDFTSFTVNANAGAGHQINAKSIHGTLTFATSNTERLRITSTGSCEWRPDGTTQAMTLDASGNLLVGKTSADFGATAGAEIRPDGRIAAGRAGETLVLNRLTSDGIIALFRKDGADVGSIGSTGGTGEVYIANNDSVGLKFTNVDAIVPSTHTGGGANRDAAIDLGYSSGGTNVRFKDLYLSGGVYLGGTVAANLLDDYEEGTWTPVNVQAGFNQTISSYSNAIYTKIGRLVRVSFTVNLAVAGRPTGWASFSGLPFTASTGSHAGGTYSSSSLSGGGRGTNAYVGGAIVYLFAAPNTVDSTAWHVSVPYST
jgi:hypothetical protein